MRLPLALPLALVLALPLACRARAAVPPVEPAAHGAGHADPAVPFALTFDALPRPDGTVVLTVRATPRQALPSLTLGVDLPQELALVAGDLRKDVTAPPPGVPVELTTRVRRASPGAAGVVVRGWAEHRGAGMVLGDERALTVFGPAPASQPSFIERTVPGPDGGALHETIVP